MSWLISRDAASILSSTGIWTEKESDWPTKYVPTSVKEVSVFDCSQSTGIIRFSESIISSFDKFLDNIHTGSLDSLVFWGLPSSSTDFGTSFSMKL